MGKFAEGHNGSQILYVSSGEFLSMYERKCVLCILGFFFFFCQFTRPEHVDQDPDKLSKYSFLEYCRNHSNIYFFIFV